MQPINSEISQSPSKMAAGLNSTGKFGFASNKLSRQSISRGDSNKNILNSDQEDHEEGSRHFTYMDQVAAAITSKLKNRAVTSEACEPERAITPISNREIFADGADAGVQCNADSNLDNTLDQYIEDLREASKRADLTKIQMETVDQYADASVEFQDIEREVERDIYVENENDLRPELA